MTKTGNTLNDIELLWKNPVRVVPRARARARWITHYTTYTSYEVMKCIRVIGVIHPGWKPETRNSKSGRSDEVSDAEHSGTLQERRT